MSNEIVKTQKVYDHIRDILIDRKNKSLLINSVNCKKNFSFIYEFSLKHLESSAEIIDEELEKLDEEQGTILNDMLQGVLNLCKSEWIGDENPVEIIPDENLRKVCSLCGQKNNKWVYNIRNKINGSKMNVGSTCIQEFPSIELAKGKTRSRLEKEAIRKVNLQKLTIKFSGIEKIINRWSEEIEKFKVLIPLKFETPYLELGENLKEIYNDFLNGKRSEECFEEISDLLDKRNKLLYQMEKYEDEHINEKYIVTRKIVNWLKQRKEFQTIETLKETGYISYETASVIHEENFINTIIKDINFLFRDTKIKIIRADYEQRGFVIQPFQHIELKLICPFDSFLSYFCWRLFGENHHIKFNLVNVFKVSKIYDKKSIEIIAEELKQRIKGKRVIISLYTSREYDYYSLNQIDVYDKKIGKVYVTDLKDFLEEFKTYGFGIKKVDEEDIIMYFDSLDKSKYKLYLPKELKELRKLSREIF